MDKKIITAILLFGAVVLGIGIILPGGNPQQTQVLPWQIETTVEGSIRVFGLRLGQSTVEQAEQRLRATAKISLFAPPRQTPVVEAYFDQINLGGLSANMVMEIAVPDNQWQTLLEQGERISTLAGDTHKVTLKDEDLNRVRRWPIASITYLPRVQLQAEVIRNRFGEPAQRIRETDSTTEHFLYPQLGLDVGLDEQGNAVFQYVAPSEFARLRQPLLSPQM